MGPYNETVLPRTRLIEWGASPSVVPYKHEWDWSREAFSISNQLDIRYSEVRGILPKLVNLTRSQQIKIVCDQKAVLSDWHLAQSPRPMLINLVGLTSLGILSEVGSFLLEVPGPGGLSWDLLVFIYFLSNKQGLRPLSYCTTLRIES